MSMLLLTTTYPLTAYVLYQLFSFVAHLPFTFIDVGRFEPYIIYLPPPHVIHLLSINIYVLIPLLLHQMLRNFLC